MLTIGLRMPELFGSLSIADVLADSSASGGLRGAIDRIVLSSPSGLSLIAVALVIGALVWRWLRRRSGGAQDVLAAIDDAVIVLDQRNRIVRFNSTARRIFSWFTDGAIGRDLHDALPSGTDLEGRLATDEKELELETPDGRRNYDLRVSELSRGRVLVLRDITRRKRDERALLERAAIVNMLRGIAAASNEASDPRAAIQSVLRIICHELDWSVGHAWLRASESDSQIVSSRLWQSREGVSIESLRAETEAFQPRPGEGVVGRVFEGARAVWIPEIDEKTDFRRYEALSKGRLRSTLVLPLSIGSEVVAALEFFAEEGAEPSDSLLESIAQIAAPLSHVFERDRAERERKRLGRKLQEASRQAGKAELATGVVHNVGNALNGVTLGLGRLRSTLSKSRVGALAGVVGLVEEHRGELGAFLTEDDRGKLIPDFLIEVSHDLEREREKLSQDLSAVVKSADHAREIVRTQQDDVTESCVVEDVELGELIEAAIEVSGFEAGASPGLSIRRDVTDTTFETDRHVLLQVLVNLLRNALEAVSGHREAGGEVCIEARGHEDRIVIAIRDNGPGIRADLREKIFAHGFTTKPEGHGYGLHASALAARQLGGDLAVESEGPGSGATFVVDLPRSVGEK